MHISAGTEKVPSLRCHRDWALMGCDDQYGTTLHAEGHQDTSVMFVCLQ